MYLHHEQGLLGPVYTARTSLSWWLSTRMISVFEVCHPSARTVEAERIVSQTNALAVHIRVPPSDPLRH